MVSSGCFGSTGDRRPVTCMIMDGVLGFAAEVAEEMGIPFIYFRTVGACSFWANFCISDVIEAGEVPLKGVYFFFCIISHALFVDLLGVSFTQLPVPPPTIANPEFQICEGQS